MQSGGRVINCVFSSRVSPGAPAEQSRARQTGLRGGGSSQSQVGKVGSAVGETGAAQHIRTPCAAFTERDVAIIVVRGRAAAPPTASHRLSTQHVAPLEIQILRHHISHSDSVLIIMLAECVTC